MGLQDFDAARKERLRDQDPLQFKLGGETFTLPTAVPAALAMDYAIATVKLAGVPISELNPDERVEAVRASFDFLMKVVGPSQAERLEAVLNNADDPVDLGTIEEVIQWMSVAYAARPTTPSSDSVPGPLANGRSSKRTKSGTAAKRSTS